MNKISIVEVDVKSFKTLFEGTQDSVFYVVDLKQGKQ